MSASKVSPQSGRILKKPLNHLKGRKWTQTIGLGSGLGSASSSQSPSKSVSPEPNCPICLGKIDDKSFTDRCYHSFCRTCLFEWSKVKAQCPVCRQPFDKIIYNVRAMDDYDEHAVLTQRYPQSSPFFSWSNIDDIPRPFRYPSTLTPLRRRMMDFERQLIDMHEYARRFQHISYLTADRRSRMAHEIQTFTDAIPSPFRAQTYSNPYDLEIFPPPQGTTAHRRYIYDSDLWVLPNGDGNTQRTREIGARFFAQNPACTHRLIPWLNRELNALITNTDEVSLLIPRIMDSLLKYDITSRDFKRVIQPYTLLRTDHFIHEFYNFARSPNDIEHYSRNSVYVPRHRTQVVESEPLTGPLGMRIEPHYDTDSDSSSSDSSIRILSPTHEYDGDISPQQLRPNLRQMRYTPHPVQYYGNETGRNRAASAPVSPASQISSAEIRNLDDYINIDDSPVDLRVSANSDMLSPDMPTPLPRGDLPDVNFGTISVVEDLDNPQPGPSGINMIRNGPMRPPMRPHWSDSDTDIDVGQELEAALARYERGGNINNNHIDHSMTIPKVENDHHHDDGTDSDTSSVLIVGYVKPVRERTPEIIQLSDESDSKRESRDDRYGKSFKHKVKKEKKEKHRKDKYDDDSHGHSSSKRKCKHKKKHHKDNRDKHKKRSKDHYHRYEMTSSSSGETSNSEAEWEKMRRRIRRVKYIRERYTNSRNDSGHSSFSVDANDKSHHRHNSETSRYLSSDDMINLDHESPQTHDRGPTIGSVIGYHNIQRLSPNKSNERIASKDDQNTDDGDDFVVL